MLKPGGGIRLNTQADKQKLSASEDLRARERKGGWERAEGGGGTGCGFAEAVSEVGT
jgi:hypothetical protein